MNEIWDWSCKSFTSLMVGLWGIGSGMMLPLRSHNSGKAAFSSCRLSISAMAGVSAPFVPTSTVCIPRADAPLTLRVLSSKNITWSGWRLLCFWAACSRANWNACVYTQNLCRHTALFIYQKPIHGLRSTALKAQSSLVLRSRTRVPTVMCLQPNHEIPNPSLATQEG